MSSESLLEDSTSEAGRSFAEALIPYSPFAVWEHFTTRGHKGRVNCVAASDACDYIVSGGADFTMRVWAYDATTSANEEALSMSYGLRAVLEHDDEALQEGATRISNKSEQGTSWCAGMLSSLFDSVGDESDEKACGVTAVGCVGKNGPMISGTAKGSVFILFLGEGNDYTTCVPFPNLHQSAITGIATPFGLGDIGKMESWFMATSSEDHAATLMFFKDNDVETIQLTHGEPVRDVQHIDSGGSDGVRWVTHTHKVVHLWSLYGQKLKELVPEHSWRPSADAPKFRQNSFFTNAVETVFSEVDSPAEVENQAITDVAVANLDRKRHLWTGSGKRDQTVKETLLFVGNSQKLSVWGLQNGDLSGPYGGPAMNQHPLVTYVDTGHSVDVDQSRDSTDFVVDVRDDYTCAVWQLNAAQKNVHAIEPQGPAGLLVAPGHKHMLLDLRHPSKVVQIRVAFDPDDAGGPCLLVACTNGSVLLWDLEGNDRGEIQAQLRSLKSWEFFLPLFLLSVSFVQLTALAFGPSIGWNQHISVPMNMTRRLVFGEINWEVSVPRDEIYVPLIRCIIALMVIFFTFALAGIPLQLSSLLHWIHSSGAYKQEVHVDEFGPMHKLAQGTAVARNVVLLTMWICSTICVAPVFKFCGQFLHCVGDPPHLAVAPQVQCYHGIHDRLSLWITLLAPLYFLILIPYAVCEGNASYMTRYKLVRPRQFWAAAALRVATIKDYGPLHPNPDYIFQTLFIDFSAKALLPGIEIFTSGSPGLQMFLLTFFCGVLWAMSLSYPPKKDKLFTGLVRHARFFTLCAMVCGWLVVLLGTQSHVPPITLLACVIIVPLHFVYKAREHPLDSPPVLRCLTSRSGDMSWTGTRLVKVHKTAPRFRTSGISSERESFGEAGEPEVEGHIVKKKMLKVSDWFSRHF